MRPARLLALAGCALLLAGPALAQAHNPFGVGISEGGGSASGLTGWLLGQQAMFERQLSAAIRAVAVDGHAMGWLCGLSFLYGVFHAAGPGHGKAVMASYLFANERALRRGLVLTGLAALLQGLVAIALVGGLAFVLNATGQVMKQAASLVETMSFAGIALLGAWLVWRKGGRLVEALRREPIALPFAAPAPLAFAGPDLAAPTPEPRGRWAGRPKGAYALGADCGCAPGAFVAEAAHGPGCGHAHAPDPRTLGEDFSWREAILTVLAAGARPCSGAILVLVFALSQGMLPVGVAAVLAMALGTAITTGALAMLAVLAKGAALRLARPGSRRGLVVIRALELCAAAAVLVAGVSLLLGYAALGGA